MTQTLRKHQQSNGMNTNPIQGLGIHKDSRTITKVQPKIRIIHIFAPEIIHTDVAHFSETVQRLTGKASSATEAAVATTSGSSVKKSIININSNPRVSKLAVEAPKKDHHHHGGYSHGHHIDDDDHHHGYDQGGFLEAFQGVNCGFLQEIGEFPLVSMEANNHHHHHLNAFGDSLSYRG